MSTSITSIAYAVPEEKLTHEELSERFGKGVMDKIVKTSGIIERRVVDSSTCASDLAFSAAELLIKKEKIERDDIDLLIFASQTPDYLLPSTSCILQNRLHLKKSCAAFDINLGCSQFLYAVATARAWIESGMATKALVLTADTPTRLIHPKDKSSVTLFGDAASACIVEKTKKNSFVDFLFGTDGSGYKDLICPTSGMRNPPKPDDFVEYEDDDGNIRANSNMYVNGFKIFTFAYKIVAQSVGEILKKNSLSVDDIDLFIFHQAGEKIVDASAKRIGIPREKVFYKMHDIGNSGGSSVAIALAEAVMADRLKRGMKIALCSFGVGLSWNAAILDWTGANAYTDADYSKSPSKSEIQKIADKI